MNVTGIKTIAEHYGLSNQMMQTAEECAELTQAIMKVFRNGLGEERDHLIEELADVQIMTYQLEYLLGDSSLDKVREEKITRQLRRIEDEKK